MTTKRSDTDFDLCQFKYADGRYCANPADSRFHGLCRSHGELEKFSKSPPVETNEFLFLEPFQNDPPSEEEVHSALAVAFRALAANQISTRRAAALGYLGQLMLLRKSSKADRETQDHLSNTIAKLLDITYNSKYRDTPLPFEFSKSAPSPAPTPPVKHEPEKSSARRGG